MCNSFKTKKISREFFNLYFLGVLVGLTWEIPFALAGKSSHLILISDKLDFESKEDKKENGLYKKGELL